jgi:hypothetical protein
LAAQLRKGRWLHRFESCPDYKINNMDDDKIKFPCYFDHNGECLICDCWHEHCAYQRYLDQDYRWENKEELEEMFKPKNDE